MILHIIEAEVCGPCSLDVQFDDGVRKKVDLTPLLTGPVFKPLKDPFYFARVVVDPRASTVVWPNGADLAPEALYDFAGQRFLGITRRADQPGNSAQSADSGSAGSSVDTWSQAKT